LAKLAACGLAEARLVLRMPDELSDGQRYRFRLAYALDRLGGPFLLADEFAANLDRTLAEVLAFNVRKLCWRSGTGLLLATPQETCHDAPTRALGGRGRGKGRVGSQPRDKKKKSSRSRTPFGSRRPPAPTGRTSLGGIPAAIPPPSPAASSSSGTAPGPSA